MDYRLFSECNTNETNDEYYFHIGLDYYWFFVNKINRQATWTISCRAEKFADNTSFIIFVGNLHWNIKTFIKYIN